MGEGRLNERDIRMAAQIQPGSYFFGVDLDAARDRTESLPWVDRAVVRRLWPNRIVVQVVETTPYALWQNEGSCIFLRNPVSLLRPSATPYPSRRSKNLCRPESAARGESHRSGFGAL